MRYMIVMGIEILLSCSILSNLALIITVACQSCQYFYRLYPNCQLFDLKSWLVELINPFDQLIICLLTTLNYAFF